MSEAIRDNLLEGLKNMRDHMDDFSPKYFEHNYYGPDGHPNAIAWVNPRATMLVHVTPKYFEDDGAERAMTLIHEFSHFRQPTGASTNNYVSQPEVYGERAASELARTSPVKALYNAENWSYFVGTY